MENESQALPAGDAAVLATIWSRFVALVIDSLILLIPTVLINSAIPVAGPIFISFWYFPIFHASPLQATIGKRAMGIRVTNSVGETLSLGMSFIRHLVAVASSCVLFLGHCVAFFTEKRQALHDIVADSIVVNGIVGGTPVWNAWLDTLKSLFGAVSKAEVFNPPLDERDETRRKLDELERLHDLRQRGVLTEEEYQKLKGKLV